MTDLILYLKMDASMAACTVENVFLFFEPATGWIPVRLEFTEDWVLVMGTGIKPVHVPYGSQVKL